MAKAENDQLSTNISNFILTEKKITNIGILKLNHKKSEFH